MRIPFRLIIYYLPLLIIGTVLYAPLVQSSFTLFKIDELKGDTTRIKTPILNLESYMNSQWQEDVFSYYNKQFGFRPLYVKLFNQIRYTIFNKAPVPGIVVAKNGDLIVEAYIDEYIGKNFLGSAYINRTINKLKEVQDSLAARGKTLIVVFAPGKASYKPEIIPDSFLSEKKDSTNYSVYREQMLKKRINFIDFNAWFFENKKKFKHKTYPKYGAHWNHYGMCLAFDSIIHYIETKQNLNLPELDYEEINYSSNLKNNDFDIGVLMNTLVPIKQDSNPYPKYKILVEQVNTKPDVLVVGDSYWWCLVGENIPINFFQEDEYWFYNKQQLIQNKKTVPVNKLNLQSSLASRNTILLIASEATYYMFPFGFVDNVHKLYCLDHRVRLNQITESIHQNNAWYNSVLKKAEENNITVEKQIKLDAEYVLSDELFNPKLNIDSIIKLIVRNKEWMTDINMKAIANKRSIQQQIKLDAEWYFENQNK